MLEIVFIVRKVLNPGFFFTQKEKPGKRGTFSLGFPRLFQAFQETGYFQWNLKEPEGLLLAFPGFSGNPAIKEEPRVQCGKSSLGFSRLFQAF